MTESITTVCYLSKEEYLVQEELADFKSEYYNGEVLAMSGGTVNHSLISTNITSLIKFSLKNKGKKCKVFNSDMKIDIPRSNSYVYADGMAVCGDIQLMEGRKDIVQNPILIVEVLSPSTQSHDLGDKFKNYLSLPSLKEYVIIYQDQPYIQVFFKKEERNWQMLYWDDLEQTILLQSLDIEIPMTDIYENVEFEL
jgi:Uma2 family endonuclease